MSDWIDYDFAVVCVVPHVHLYTATAVGVILQARTEEFIDARLVTDEAVLGRLASPGLASRLRRYLESYRATARGEPDASPIARLPPSERFHWLTAPRSDQIQCSPVHTGRSRDLPATLEALFRDYAGASPS